MARIDLITQYVEGTITIPEILEKADDTSLQELFDKATEMPKTARIDTLKRAITVVREGELLNRVYDSEVDPITQEALSILESDEKQYKAPAREKLETAHTLPAACTLAELYRVGALGVKKDEEKAKQIIEQQNPFHPRVLACKARLSDPALAEVAYYLAPDDDFVLATLADVCRRSNDPKRAFSLAERALEINPNNTHALCCLGALDNSRAYSLYEKAYLINYRNEQALLGLARHTRTASTAEKYLQEAIQVNPNSARAHFELAQHELINEKPADACHHFELAVKKDPKNAEIPYQYGELFRRGGHGVACNIPAAIKFLTKSLDRDPNYYDALTSLASILMVSDVALDAYNPVYALELCERAFKQKQDDPFLLSMLGRLLAKPNPKRAEEILKKASDLGDVYAQAALALLSRSRHLLEKVLEKHGDDFEVLLTAARFFQVRKEYATAQEYLSKALAIIPSSPEALTLQRDLQGTA